MRLQHTIRQEFSLQGQGLHTGRHVRMMLKPARRDSGVVFYRKDKDQYIKADVHSVSDTSFATTLGTSGTKIKTVEHLLSALSGLEIDNVLIELDGSEIPILDGSSKGFVEGIMKAGISNQAAERPYISITKPVFFKTGNAEFLALPMEGRKITYHIEYDHHMLGSQSLCVELKNGNFAHELAPARTFGFLKDIEYLKSKGLARGGSLENAVVLDDKGVLNPSGLRFKDEFIRHKILDFIGDISLCGYPIHGHFIVSRSGHTANLCFLKNFLSSDDCYAIVPGIGLQIRASA